MLFYVHTIHGILYRIKLLRFGFYMYIIGVQNGVSCIYIPQVPSEMAKLKTKGESWTVTKYSVISLCKVTVSVYFVEFLQK